MYAIVNVSLRKDPLNGGSGAFAHTHKQLWHGRNGSNHVSVQDTQVTRTGDAWDDTKEEPLPLALDLGTARRQKLRIIPIHPVSVPSISTGMSHVASAISFTPVCWQFIGKIQRFRAKQLTLMRGSGPHAHDTPV